MGRPVRHDGAVGLDAMRQKMMCSRSLAAVGAGLIWTHGRSGNLTGHGGKNQVSFKGEAAFTYGLCSDHESRESRLHIGCPQTEDLAIPDSPPEIAVRFQLAAKHSVFFGAGVTSIHVTIDHQRDATTTAF